MRDDRECLLDVLEAIEQIERYAAKGRETFDCDELIQTWAVHHLQVIRQRCRTLSPRLKKEHRDIPWSKIRRRRNILFHQYFAIDLDKVWSVVEHDLPDLKRKVEAIVQELGGES